MANGTMNVVLFGDETANVRAIFQRVHHYKQSSALVGSFLEKAYTALHEEAMAVPKSMRETIPDSTSIFDMMERYYDIGIPNPATEGALLCISQMASFMGSFEERPDDFIDFEICFIGWGIGLLAAAAVASSRTLATLPTVMVEIVRIAFRTGTLVSRVSQQLQQPGHSKEAWAMIVYDVTESAATEALDDYHTSKHIPTSDRAYISAVSKGTVTISAPPSRLQQLLDESELFKNTKTVQIPIYALYHASHLYDMEDVQEILQPSASHLEGIHHAGRPVLSTVTGQEFSVSSTFELLEKLLHEILVEPQRWDAVQKGVVSEVNESDISICRVSAFGTTHAAAGLVATLRSKTSVDVAQEDLAKAHEPIEIERRLASVDKIAIVGMSGRFPGATSCEELWEVLEQGRDVHKTIPRDRLNVDTHYDKTGKKKNTSHTPYGCFIDEPGLFDARFFSMSPREAAQTDPMHRLAIATAYEALEMAGYVPNRTPSTNLHRVGTFYGQTSDDWREVNAAQTIDTYFIPGGVRAFAPGRINYHFKFSGPSFSVDTACSSSFAALQLACTSLWAGDCDMAVTGGLNILTAPDIFAGLSRGQFLSKTGGCKTWDASADGYCRADGVGTVILKRLEDALDDKDNILGTIVGTATNHSAEAISITHPHAGAQSYLYESVLHTAGIDPHDISYVEMHGTGTQAGDSTEVRSVTDVFAPKHRSRSHPLHLGAVKSNVGHGEAAAGITALIKVLLMLQKNAIPQHVGIKTAMNPKFPQDLKERNVHIPFQNTPWPATKKRVAFLNNFSAAGGNTALLLEDAPPKVKSTARDPRSSHVVAVSAKSISSLKKNTEHLISYIEENPDTSLSSLSYTTCARRIHHNYRVAVAVNSINELKGLLGATLEKTPTPISSIVPKVGFVFTGQGAFYPSLGQRLFIDSPSFRTDITDMDNIAVGQGLPSFLSVIEGSLSSEEAGSLSPLITQLATTCVQIALAKLWNVWGLKPDVVLGHSLGEYAALNAAGVLSVSDTIHLVGQRAKLLQEECTSGTHAMLAVKASLPSVQSAANGAPFQIACLNAELETVLAGTIEEIDSLSKTLTAAGLKNMKLNVPFAFHSSQVDRILDSFEDVASAVLYDSPNVPIISPLLGKVISEGGSIHPNYLRRHARETVNFLGALQAAHDEVLVDEKTAWIEIGPHPICSGMIKSILPGANVNASLHRTQEPWTTLTESLSNIHCAGLPVDWTEVHREYDESHQLLNLPSYSFDNKNYWIDYVNDWCLNKGDTPQAKTIEGPPEKLGPWERKSKLSTSSVHVIVEENVDGAKGKLVVQSDIQEDVFSTAINGHSVNGAGLCPSSIYADMAFTVAEYLYKQIRPGENVPHMDVCRMQVVKPLILNKNSNAMQIVQVTATADLDSGKAELRYASVNPAGKETFQHAQCTVEYVHAADWLSEWARNAYMVTGRIDMLKKSTADGALPKITRGLAYKLFSALVRYDERYRGMQEVILDSSQFEATARVSFQTDEGHFFCSPYWIDSLAHLSGFIMNGSDAVDSKTYVYISHGWKSMRFARPFLKTHKYRSYVRMQPSPSEANVYEGDVYIFEEEENIIIGVVGGLKFQRIPCATLDNILPPDAKPKAAAATAPPATAQQAASKAKAVPAAKKTKSHVPAANTPKPVKEKKEKDITARAFEIIAGEAEVEPVELQDECTFASLGVDSLLSLAIAAKFREELNLDVPGTLFIDNPTVKKLKIALSQSSSATATPEDSEKSGSDATPVVTSDSSMSDAEDEAEDEAPKRKSPKDQAASSQGEVENLNILLRTTISEQMGIPMEEVVGENDLNSLGMDSLMALTTLAILREETGMELPPTLFQDYPSIVALEKFMAPTLESSTAPSKPKSNPARNKQSSKTPDLSQYPKAQSMLVQGDPKTATTTLFLLPDGSGSATSYANISKIGRTVCVYGLNCPFMTTPKDFTCGIKTVSSIYMAEIQRRQPHGPYTMGGWSAGGVVAYEVACQLLAIGETVDRLILLDSPCPLALEPLPSRLHHFFDRIGLLGSGGAKPPAWLLPHFEASINALTAYNDKAEPMDPAKAPKTFAIWAREGVCGKPGDPKPPVSDDDPKSMKWLLNNRTDFGYNGWDRLLGAENIRTTNMEGNHFTIMRTPRNQQLGKLIAQGLDI